MYNDFHYFPPIYQTKAQPNVRQKNIKFNLLAAITIRVIVIEKKKRNENAINSLTCEQNHAYRQ